MRVGLGARVAFILAALVALTALAVSAASILSTSREVNDDIDAFLKGRAAEITSGERADPRDGRRGGGGGDRDDELADAIEQVLDDDRAVDADSEVQALDENGEVVATIGVALPVDDGDEKLADKAGPDRFRTVEIDGDEYRMITSHVDGGGAVQVARSLESTNALLDTIRSRSLLVGLALSLVAAGIGWLLARATTRPLRRLTRTVETVAATGDLSTPVATDGSDEVGRLAREFDRMLDALATSREQQHRLVQDAAHELRTPLTSINANVDLLRRAPDLDDETRQQTLTAVRSELTALQTVLTEIIDLATDEHDPDRDEPVDLAEVTERAVGRFRARSDRQVELSTQASVVIGDAVALERAVSNLLSNADKYSPEGAAVTVEVADGRVAVADRGPGIDADERGRVFDRFYRGPEARSQPGSGLGLAIVAKIVAEHGGATFVEDGEGAGAVVGFVLPVHAGE